MRVHFFEADTIEELESKVNEFLKSNEDYNDSVEAKATDEEYRGDLIYMEIVNSKFYPGMAKPAFAIAVEKVNLVIGQVRERPRQRGRGRGPVVRPRPTLEF